MASSFQELINGDKPVLVDFYADWCGPCRYQSPILKQVADQVGELARVIKVDVDRNPAAAQQFGVRGIPHFVFFDKTGQPQAAAVGRVPRQVIEGEPW